MRRKQTDNISYLHQRSSLWQNCTNLQTLKQIHARMVINGFNSNRSALREIIYACAVALAGTMDYAHKLFSQISEPDFFMWNTMLRGSSQSPNPLNTILLYTQMEKSNILPDNYTFSFVLKACTRLYLVKLGHGVHARVVKYGFDSVTFVRNTLIYFHANCGDLRIASALFDGSGKDDVVVWSALTAGYARRGELGMARWLFDKMPVKDLVSWNVMITGYAKKGKMESARELFDRVPKRDVVSWNAMISGYVLSGCHEKAWDMFEEMRSVGERPDEVTVLGLVSACADSGDLNNGKKIHETLVEIIKNKKNLSTMIWNALIDMYAKCGSIESAQEIFRGITEKDVSTWNSMLVGLAFHGHNEQTIHLFSDMCRMRYKPNEISFVAVLVACSHAGKVEEGRRYFNLMRDQYGIEPNIKHYGCMVDMLGRAGLLNEAFKFVEAMEMEPNGIIWRTLLAACRIHGDVELGSLASEQLRKVRCNESGDYILLSNLYASHGEWDGVQKVRKLMDDGEVKKDPGHSLVEADSKPLLKFLLDSKPKVKSKRNEI
ncbi:Pentatricopeptide repeat [Dillenia turbinata]|uniref:Pentatricopeptide repeat n=1 Tax=Dillenia turbinata TaxID=194707 RepID=A0AAN8UIE6_9MAGN